MEPGAAERRVTLARMAALLVTLLVVWLALAVVGIVLEGSLWLFWVAVALFLATLAIYLARYLRSRA